MHNPYLRVGSNATFQWNKQLATVGQLLVFFGNRLHRGSCCCPVATPIPPPSLPGKPPRPRRPAPGLGLLARGSRPRAASPGGGGDAGGPRRGEPWCRGAVSRGGRAGFAAGRGPAEEGPGRAGPCLRAAGWAGLGPGARSGERGAPSSEHGRPGKPSRAAGRAAGLERWASPSGPPPRPAGSGSPRAARSGARPERGRLGARLRPRLRGRPRPRTFPQLSAGIWAAPSRCRHIQGVCACAQREGIAPCFNSTVT